MAIAGKVVIRIENFKKYINSNLVVHLLVRFRVIWTKIAKVIQGWNGVMFRGPPCIYVTGATDKQRQCRHDAAWKI